MGGCAPCAYLMPKEAREGCLSPETEVTGGFEPP